MTADGTIPSTEPCGRCGHANRLHLPVTDPVETGCVFGHALEWTACSCTRFVPCSWKEALSGRVAPGPGELPYMYLDAIADRITQPPQRGGMIFGRDKLTLPELHKPNWDPLEQLLVNDVHTGIQEFVRAQLEAEQEIIDAACLEMLYGDGGANKCVVVHRAGGRLVLVELVDADRSRMLDAGTVVEFQSPVGMEWASGWSTPAPFEFPDLYDRGEL